MDPTGDVTLRVPEPLPPLSAAVEAAAYRIVVEALTNIVRHANATTGSVTLSCDRQEGHAGLHVVVVDDGVGCPGTPSGVGLRAMTERAEELGGRIAFVSSSRGTRVHAWLPR
jgi:signal transduction histidine kinase